MTDKEKVLLGHIEREVASKGRYPSYASLAELMGYKSKRSVFLLINSLVEQGYLRKNADARIRLTNNVAINTSVETVNVPLLGDVACGTPIFAEENVEAVFAISTQIAKPNNRYFLLRANGDSMNSASDHRKGIEDGELVLIRAQTYAENGDWVVAIINNEGTVKEFRRLEDHVALLPHSTNTRHKPIIVSDDLIIQGVVVDVLKGLDKLDF